jgi:PAS domain S-box-containing protein
MSALRAGHVVTIEDAVTDPVTAPFAESAYLPLGIRSCAVVPLQRRGVWVSSLALNHDAPRAWRTEELALLATAGERTWEAAEKLRLDVRLRESTALLQLVNSLTPVLLYAKDRARRLTMVNPATVRLLGKSEAELLGKDAPEYIDDPAAAAAIQANDDEIMRSGVTQTFEEIVPQADGIRVYLSAKSPLRDAAGKVVGLIGVSADITDRKSAEEALRRSEAAERVARRQLLTALEGARMVAWEWEFATGRSDRFGPVREVLGLDGDRAIDFLQHVHPDDRERVQTETMRAARGEGQYALAFRFVRPDGRTIWVHDSATLVRDPDGRPERLSGVVTDVTARREAEAALRASEEQLRFVADHAPVLIVHCDAAGRFRFVNEAYAEYAGLAREDVLGRHVADVVGDAAWREIRPHVERALAGERVEFEEEVHYHGRRGARWVHALYSPQRDATGHVSGFVGVIQDVTTRHRADLALRQADRMEAVGRLAGGVAHEANNQMTVVLGCAAFALRNPHLPAEVRQELQQIRQAAERTAGITSQLLAFSRRQMLRPEPLDLNGVIEALAPILARTLGESGALALELSPEVGPVLADRGQVEQVLVNLTFNARDAMPAGGRLTIGTAAVTLAAPQPGSSPGEPLPAGRYGVLTVRDTGHGMGPDTLARAFEPFFTTKPLGQGTGLGLSTVYGIVRQLGGDIVVQSELGVGTVFRIYLPAASIGAPAGGGNGATPPVPTAGGTVLLVEDEPAVRQLAARSLEAAGFTVLQARHGGEALEVLARAGTAVRAVVSDVAMPVMSGGELRERLARLHPSLPVLLISGHAEDELLRRGLVGESSGLLSKPFAPEELAARVRAMVERA